MTKLNRTILLCFENHTKLQGDVLGRAQRFGQRPFDQAQDAVAHKMAVGVIDLRGLLPDEEIAPDTDVLNGIAYDAASERIFVTGKRWSKLFEIEIIPQ